MDDGFSQSEPIDLFHPLEISESEMRRQSEMILSTQSELLSKESMMIQSTPSESLSMYDRISELGLLDFFREDDWIQSTPSESLSMDDRFSESEMIHSIPQTGRNRSLNSKALAAPEHSTSIRKRRLPTIRASAIQQRLQTLIAGARQSWTCAIFWKAFNNTDVENIIGYSKITDYVPRILDWGTGYYEGEEDKLSGTQSSKTEQDHRKRSLRDLYPELEMNDLERFFVMSKADIFFPGNGFPGRALCTSTAIWVSGAQKLGGLYCKHANRARECGIQTLVCIPLEDGVVELGSSALIFPDSEFDLLDRVRPLFKFMNNICIQEIGTYSAGSSSIPLPIHPGNESESSVGNRPMFQQGDSSSQRDKKTQSNSDSGSDSRYLEVATQILRHA